MEAADVEAAEVDAAEVDAAEVEAAEEEVAEVEAVLLDVGSRRGLLQAFLLLLLLLSWGLYFSEEDSPELLDQS